jgi:hypothetical protein
LQQHGEHQEEAHRDMEDGDQCRHTLAVS